MAVKSYSLGKDKKTLSEDKPSLIDVSIKEKNESYYYNSIRTPEVFNAWYEGRHVASSYVKTFYIINIDTDYVFYENRFEKEDDARDFLYKLSNDLKDYYDIEPYYFERKFASMKRWSDSHFYFYEKKYAREVEQEEEEEKKRKEEEKKRKEEEKKRKEEAREKEYGWLDLSPNNIDLRLPESSLSKSQQSQISNICNSRSITLFEDFDKRYCIMYFELQPSSFSQSMRFAFKQISSLEEYDTIRQSKECKNSAMRVALPILEILSQQCDDVEEEKLFDLIDGKIERICFHGKINNNLYDISVCSNLENPSTTITQPVQLSIPINARKCALSDGKEGKYDGYKAYIECSFDTGKSVRYVFYQNSLTDDVDNYWQCPVPKDMRKDAKTDIISVLKDAGFTANFEIIERFKAKNLKTLILNR